MNENFENLQIPPKSNVKNIADIVFVIDFSGSMTPVIEGVKNYILDFIKGLEYNPDNLIDWRIGFIGHYYGQFFIKKFTTDTNDFSNALTPLSTSGNEYTLPALDWALDFDWREKVHKIVIIFTDEPLKTGAFPDEQRSKMNELAEKITNLHAKCFYYGVECPEYEDFFQNVLPRSLYTVVDFYSLSKTDMQKVLEQIGRTLSDSTRRDADLQIPGGNKAVKRDIYGVANKPGFKIDYL